MELGAREVVHLATGSTVGHTIEPIFDRRHPTDALERAIDLLRMRGATSPRGRQFVVARTPLEAVDRRLIDRLGDLMQRFGCSAEHPGPLVVELSTVGDFGACRCVVNELRRRGVRVGLAIGDDEAPLYLLGQLDHVDLVRLPALASARRSRTSEILWRAAIAASKSIGASVLHDDEHGSLSHEEARRAGVDFGRHARRSPAQGWRSLVAPRMVIPADEGERLAALRAGGIEVASDPALDLLVGAIAHRCSVPICLISIIDETQQRPIASFGASIGGIDRAGSICAQVVGSALPVAIENLAIDRTFRECSVVVGEPFARSYLGAPIRGPHGTSIGVVSVLDTVARLFANDEVSLLCAAARLIGARYAPAGSREMATPVGGSNRGQPRVGPETSTMSRIF